MMYGVLVKLCGKELNIFYFKVLLKVIRIKGVADACESITKLTVYNS